MISSIRRVVTTHSPDGRSVIADDRNFEPTSIPSGDAQFCLLWAANNLPIDNNDYIDGRSLNAGLTIHQGSVIRMVDLSPQCVSPMHRTNSLDYGIVISGKVELELDDGSITLLSSGDVVVQRGTMHLWRNPSLTETCRIAFVLTKAEPVSINGIPFPEVHP